MDTLHFNATQCQLTASVGTTLSWSDNRCSPGCGPEAACRPFPNNTFMCVCPHDVSPPTADLKCPNRSTVPVEPRPIHNIIPPIKVNSTQPDQLHNVTTTQQTKLTHEERYPVFSNLYLWLTVVLIVVALVGAIVCIWKRKRLSTCMARSNKKSKSPCNPSPLSLSKGLLVPDRYTPNPQYTVCPSPDSIPVPLLPRNKLCFIQEIGEGCFGKVYKGHMAREDDDQPETVAVKVLKETASSEVEDDFMREVEIMSTFRHANILSLIGVVAREDGCSPWMVFEFMPHGDLAEVLRSNSRQLWRPVPGLPPLNKDSLLSIALQIAAGMRYLAAQRFVHRDLACRNCLVGAGLTVKIADFGMSRDVYTCDYYKVCGSRPLPVRWMSPESIMYGRFTLESDVWSYGVVLWEIFSLGRQPYYGHSNEEVMKLIVQGIMLSCPEDCPPLISELMRSCWKTEPRDRIRFPDIHSYLLKAQENATAAASTLPRPPGGFPVAQLGAKAAELLDGENYLLPQTPSPGRCDYLQPLPD
ncbi:muscle, skeletal receptor tyrosine-protein kinase [Anabrus simplex]|uniref:muscle, skeletal receptor tyrosine-protein kinase n=1 Tax=Anabrus simplex TaxID=316456 RepID=UPI0034DD0D9D